MSLRVWLPLTGDLRNNGLSTTTITNNGAVVNDNGKIGKCYSFATSAYLLGTQNFLTNSTSDWTFCCWMKLNATTQGQCLFSCRTVVNTTGIAIFYYGSQWLIDDGGRWQFTPTNTIVANTWYHICVVRRRGVGVYLYVNGSLDSSTTETHAPISVCTTHYAIGSSQTSSTAASGNPLNGYLNDVRIYDHALSVKEIKEISKGLVCHYTFRSTQSTFSSVLYDSSGNGYNGETYGGSVVADSARNLTSVSFTANSQRMRVLNLPTPCFANSYTYAWWGKFTKYTKHMMWGYGDGNRLNMYMCSNLYWNTGDGTKNPFGVSASAFGDNNWHHFVITGDGIASKLYVDGEFKGQSTTYRAPTGTTLYFNGWDTGSNYKFNGCLSDFRLYSTVLSDGDIKMLYHTPISIAKTGETFIQGEFVEQ